MVNAAGFLLCALIIFYAGKKLSFYGSLIAEKTGLGQNWIGLVLMASVTSLPELMVGISSSAIVQSADLAVGDILGSCAFNLMILAVLDAFLPKHKALFGIVSPGHLLNAGLGIFLMAMVGIAIFLPRHFVLTPWIGLSSLLFIVVYFVSIRVIYMNEKKIAAAKAIEILPQSAVGISLRKTIGNYSLFAMVIIAAALTLPFFAGHLADATGLGKTFVGTFFVAVSTSLPEVAVSVAAVRMTRIDLAVGNLLGSNIFNVLILAIDDAFYTKGLILKDASDFHLVSVLSTILMSAVVVIGLSYRAGGKPYLLAWDAAAIFLIYMFNLALLYRLTSFSLS